MPQYAVRRFNAALTEVLSFEPEPLDEFAMLSWVQVQQAQADEGDRLDIHTLPDVGAEMPDGWPETPIVDGGAGTVLVGEPAPGVALAASTILFGDGVDVLVEDGVASVTVPASGGTADGDGGILAAVGFVVGNLAASLATHGHLVMRDQNQTGNVTITLPAVDAAAAGRGFRFSHLGDAGGTPRTLNIAANASDRLIRVSQNTISAGGASVAIPGNNSPVWEFRAWRDTGNVLGNGADAGYWFIYS